MYLHVETERVPIARLITNLEHRVQLEPKNAEALYALGRVHSMAYAQKLETFEVKTNGEPYFGSGTHAKYSVPQIRQASDPNAETKAKEHLKQAIVRYRKALEINTNHLPAQLGLGWCLEQFREKQEAVQAYRKALDLAWKKEGALDSLEMGLGATEEAALYLVGLLDPVKDAAEIKRIESYQAALKKKGRWITPILIPMDVDFTFQDLVTETPGVAFDLDGSGLERRWSWISPKAGWLVFDASGAGEITSGLQMIGGVTFWVFWENGYDALAALDDDGDGVVQGA